MNVGPSTNQIATFLVYFARMRSSVGGHTCARIRHVQRAKINSSNVMINEGRFGLNPWPDTAKKMTISVKIQYVGRIIKGIQY